MMPTAGQSTQQHNHRRAQKQAPTFPFLVYRLSLLKACAGIIVIVLSYPHWDYSFLKIIVSALIVSRIPFVLSVKADFAFFLKKSMTQLKKFTDLIFIIFKNLLDIEYIVSLLIKFHEIFSFYVGFYPRMETILKPNIYTIRPI